MADPDRRGGGGLSLRTLAIASAASLAAATVTSRLFPPGTIYASAVTPVLVAAVSELLRRPTDRVVELRRQRRTVVVEAQEQRIEAGQSTPIHGSGGLAESTTRPAEIRIHGRQPLRRRILHPKVWITTGLIAFAIAIAVLTVPELIFGGAVATNDRTTFFGGGGGSRSTQTHTTPATTQTQTTTTVTQTVTTPTTTDTATATTPTPTDTTTQTAPGGGTPAPTTTSPTTTTP